MQNMAHLSYSFVLILIFLMFHCCPCSNQEVTISRVLLSDGEPVKQNFCSKSTTDFCLKVVTPSVAFVIFQAHVFLKSIKASYLNGSSSEYVVGSDVGLLSIPKQRDSHQKLCWRLTCKNDSSGMDDAVLVFAKSYGASDPLPGGCNQEFRLENDPNIHLNYSLPRLSTIQFAYGNAAVRGKCGDAEDQKTVHYDVYQYFMNERNVDGNYVLNVIQNILLNRDIENIAHRVTSLSRSDKTSLRSASYAGHGMVYIVVITGIVGSSVSYVPSVSFGYDHANNPNWHPEGDLESKIVVTILAVVGLFICFFGHRFFKIELLFFGYLASILTVFILVEHFSSIDFVVCLLLSATLALVGGIVWLVIWLISNKPRIAVLLVALLLGYLIASVILNVTPLGQMESFRSLANFELLFFACILVFVIFWIFALRMTNIASCSIVGSFMVALAVDVYLGGFFKYILLNSISKSTIPHFAEAFTFIPFQSFEYITCASWAFLAMLGIIFQHWRERNNPKFPESPLFVRRPNASDANIQSRETLSPTDDSSDETRPLLQTAANQGEQTGRNQPVENLNQFESDWWRQPPPPPYSPSAPDSEPPGYEVIT